MMAGVLITILNAFLTSLNVVMYVLYDNPINLGAAIFIGILTIFNMVLVWGTLR